MIVEVTKDIYRKYFKDNPHSFISERFIELNRNKVDGVLRLVSDKRMPVIGFIAGVKGTSIHSPFSAPFGGFHYQKENVYISEIEEYIRELKSYLIQNNYSEINLVLPPDIYQTNFNSKVANVLLREEFKITSPDITCWVDLEDFELGFKAKNVRKYLRQAIANGLSFSKVSDKEDCEAVYEIVKANRRRLERPIYMSFKDLLDIAELWPVDFFKVTSKDLKIVSSAIFYRNHPKICFGVFWGDTESGRLLRAMDFLAYNLWGYYKNEGYKYLDLGISTESGKPNEGLLRFKESHLAHSSLRLQFCWKSH